jgi:3-oxoacyl-[acyl-carrier protein] reductase
MTTSPAPSTSSTNTSTSTSTSTSSTSTTPARRVAIVTGGSRGIGRAISRRLAADGYAIGVNYAGNSAAAEESLAEIRGAGGTAIALQADVADERQVAALFDTVEQTFGGVDAVVNSAGRIALSPIAELDLDTLDALHRTNIRGAFVVAQQAARRLRPGGAFVGVSTTVVTTQLPGYGAYAASKAAVEGMTLILARELRGRDVTVNTIAPGPTATDLFLDGKSEEQVAALAAAPPLERLGTPEDIAAAVAFLTGPDGRWINGQVLPAHPGVCHRYPPPRPVLRPAGSHRYRSRGTPRTPPARTCPAPRACRRRPRR